MSLTAQSVLAALKTVAQPVLEAQGDIIVDIIVQGVLGPPYFWRHALPDQLHEPPSSQVGTNLLDLKRDLGARIE